MRDANAGKVGEVWNVISQIMQFVFVFRFAWKIPFRRAAVHAFWENLSWKPNTFVKRRRNYFVQKANTLVTLKARVRWLNSSLNVVLNICGNFIKSYREKGRLSIKFFNGISHIISYLPDTKKKMIHRYALIAARENIEFQCYRIRSIRRTKIPDAEK